MIELEALRAAWATVRFEADEARAAAGIIIRGRERSGRSDHRNECDRFRAERAEERAGATLVGQWGAARRAPGPLAAASTYT